MCGGGVGWFWEIVDAGIVRHDDGWYIAGLTLDQRALLRDELPGGNWTAY